MKLYCMFVLAALIALTGCSVPVNGQAPSPQPTEDADMVPRTRSTLAMKDGWSSSGKLNRLDKSGQQVTLQADFPESDVYTVQFAVNAPSGTSNNTDGIYRAIATVQWTVEGNTITRQIDVGNGTSISAPSQAVRVSVVDATQAAKVNLAGVSYGVTITVTRGVRAFGTLPPTLFGESITIPGNGSADVAIPTGAGVTSVEITALDGTNPGTNPVIFVEHQNTGTFKAYTQNQFDSGFVAVAPSTVNIHIGNLTGDLILIALTWGIDG